MSSTLTDHPRVLNLQPGELVRVRSAREIFSTLDEKGTLEALPFMPEMLRFCGRTFPVFKRADKTCDGTTAMRRMDNTVHLGNLRCDGSSHGGCDAGCLTYWKEAWLERSEGEDGKARSTPELDADEQAYVSEALLPATTQDDSEPSVPAYRCQATEIPRAARRLPWWELNQYPKDARNWGWWKLLRVLPIALFNKFQKLNRRFMPDRPLFFGGQRYPFLRAEQEGTVLVGELDLQPGELVRIKSREEIFKTLSGDPPKTRGLSFDVEMLKYCGRTARVTGRVERIIDEGTGKMIEINSDCIVLDGVVCTADYHRFCTRSITPYWREAWLERAD
jgi:hypothetical protein